MSKRMMTICDLCGTVVEKGFIIEMREDLPQNAVGTVESWDVCPQCRQTLDDFFKSKKPSDVPIYPGIPLNNTGGTL